MVKKRQDLENPEEFYSPGGVKERHKNGILDDEDATALSPSELAELDQIEAGIKNENSFYKSEEDDENEPEETEQPDEGDASFSYRNETPKKGKAGGRIKKKLKKKLIIGGILGGTGAGIILIILLFLTALKLPHMVANISVYEFARLSRNYSRSVAQVTEEKIAIDAESTFAQDVKARWTDLRSKTWGKLDKYRPQKVLDNLKSGDNFEYTFTEKPRTLFPGTREVLDGVKVNGQQLNLSDAQWFDVKTKFTDRLEFNGRLTAQLEDALKESNTLVRGKVAQSIRDELGIRLRRWERLTKSYQDALDAERENIRLTAAAAESKANPPAVDAIDEAVTEADNASQETLKSDAKLNTFIKSDGQSLATETDQIIERTTFDAFNSTATKIISTASTIYAIAVPACLIFEGSVENSGSVVNANSDRAVKTYYTIAAGAHQQQNGQADPNNIGGLNDEIGDISNSPAELRASGKLTSTESFSNPQVGGAQYTIFDAVLGGGIVSGFFNTVMRASCPTLTSISTGVTLAAAEIGINVASGGAEESFTLALKTAFTDIFKEVFTKKFAVKVIRDVGLIEIGSYIAKMIVVSHMGQQASGIPNGQELAIEADQGANIAAGDIDRQQFYGRPMTQSQIVMSNYQDAQYIALANSKKSVFDRYLNPHNPVSALTNTALAMDNGLRRPIAVTLRGLFAKIGTLFEPSRTVLLSLLSGNQQKALAATANTNYHLVQWGWTDDEEAVIQGNPEKYSPINNAEYVERNMDLQALKVKYDKCFTSDMGTLLSEKMIVRDSDGNVKPDEGDCAPNKLGSSNEEAFRYRLYMRYEGTLSQLVDVQEPASADPPQSTTPTGGGTPTPPPAPGPPPIVGDTSNIPCAAGTDYGVVDGWKNFQKYQIRVCLVQGTVVNSQISKQIDNLYTDAHATGLIMTGGGFRTYSDQVGVYLAHCKGIGLFPTAPYGPNSPHCPGASIPGNSNHQMGFAIDFNCNGKLIPQKTPAPGTNVCYDWLLVNAGLPQHGPLYEWGKGTIAARAKPGYEAWHWSVDGN